MAGAAIRKNSPAGVVLVWLVTRALVDFAMSIRKCEKIHFRIFICFKPANLAL